LPPLHVTQTDMLVSHMHVISQLSINDITQNHLGSAD